MSFTLSIGGLPIRVQNAPVSALPPALLPYLTGNAEPVAVCSGALGRVGCNGNRVLFDSRGIWCVEKAARGVRLVLRQGGPEGRHYQALELHEELTRARAVLDPRGIKERKPFFLREPLLELWISFLLMRGRGLLIHACGVLTPQGVHVFAGDSGAGKTTLARLVERHGAGMILSDDRLIIRPAGGEFLVYGTPWHGLGRFSSPQSGRLLNVNFLHKSQRSALQPLKKKEALERLLRVCFMAGWPRSDVGFSFRMAGETIERLPCRILEFRKDHTALRAGGLL